jgi:predicted ATP-grasp superfamily ATP-dependent carboligase
VARIMIGGAGGAASNGFIRSLRASDRGDHLIGTNASPTDLLLAAVDERHLLPSATSEEFANALFWLLNSVHADFLHLQSDPEVRRVSELRHVVKAANTKLFLPNHSTILLCQDKWASYCKWVEAGLTVPETRLISSPRDLDEAFSELPPPLWIREIGGAAGAGAVRTDNPEFARQWIDVRNGWDAFTAAIALRSETVTWQSIWNDGELVVAQTRRRRSWAYSRHTPTGVTGITGVGETCSDEHVDAVARGAIEAVDAAPHGIFGVDMVFDHDGVPNPTEINIGRFFTTHEFFTRAGLNLPAILVELALDGVMPDLAKRVNPLPDGLLWIRGMDVEPVLTTAAEVERMSRQVESRSGPLRG